MYDLLLVSLFHSQLDGSFLELGRQLWKNGLKYIYDVFPSPIDPVAWRLLGSYAAFELALVRLVPGKPFTATATATGHV
jgi:7-dehydrocholesterol reductase